MHHNNASEVDHNSFIKYSEQSTEDPISLLHDPQKFTTLFHTLAAKCFHLLQIHDHQEAFTCLNKLQDMLQLGKTILNSANPYWKLCFDLNSAAVSQKLNQMYRSLKYCEKAQSELQQLLKTQKRADFYLHLAKQLIKLKFQYCGVLSRLGQHLEAQKACAQNFKVLQEYLKQLLKVARQQLNSTPSTPNKKSKQSVLFVSCVGSFAERTIKNLLCEIQQPVDGNCIKSPFYYWVCNPDNNCKQITQLFLGCKQNEQWKRSVLGVNKRAFKILDLNVGSIISLESRHIDEFRIITPAQEQLFKDKLYEIVFYVSVNYFILSTELRFTEKSQETYSSSSYISKRYGYDENYQKKQLSQAYHLKAIDIITQSIGSQIPYLTHIIDSYQKHYITNKPLQKIVAIPDQSLWESSFALQKQQNKKKMYTYSSSKDDYTKTKSKKKMNANSPLVVGEKSSTRKDTLNQLKGSEYQLTSVKKGNKSVGKQRKKNKMRKSNVKLSDIDN